MESEHDFLLNVRESLNEEQRMAFDICVAGDVSVFCTGQGGTGKSWLLECIVKYFRQYKHGLKVAVTASTGVASFLAANCSDYGSKGTVAKQFDRTIRSRTRLPSCVLSDDGADFVQL